MSDPQAATKHDADGAAPAGRERRQHHHLRDLIDEMLASLRAAANRDIITAEERADAEAQLKTIMARVHEEALQIAANRPKR